MGDFMKACTKMLALIAVIIALAGSIFLLKEDNVEDHILEVTDLKQGEDFQFRDMPWGASIEEVKAMITTAHDLTEVGVNAEYLSTEAYYLVGKRINPIYQFKNEKLESVQIVYGSGEKNQKKYLDLLVEKLVEVFGQPTDKLEKMEERFYRWETDNTVMRISATSTDSIVFLIYRKEAN